MMIRDGNVLLLKIPLLCSHSVFYLFRPCRGLASYDVIKIRLSNRDSLGPGYVDHLVKVMAKGDGREVGFQDGGCFSRFLKRERINNQTFTAFQNCG